VAGTDPICGVGICGIMLGFCSTFALAAAAVRAPTDLFLALTIGAGITRPLIFGCGAKLAADLPSKRLLIQRRMKPFSQRRGAKATTRIRPADGRRRIPNHQQIWSRRRSFARGQQPDEEFQLRVSLSRRRITIPQQFSSASS
jgi:hypothetical protein